MLMGRQGIHSRASRTSDRASYLLPSFAFLGILPKPRRFPRQNSSIDVDLGHPIALYSRPMSQAPTILHIPHSRPDIPADVRKDILLNDAELHRELLEMTDWHTEELFDVGIGSAIVYPVSRLVADPERFVDDKKEPMSKKGMGAVYTRTSDGKTLRRMSPDERALLLRQYYMPHHDRLAKAVAHNLSKHGQCLIIDCHSFSSMPLPHEPKQSLPRPDICIGTDPFHTPEALIRTIEKACCENGLIVKQNFPFSGSLVPSAFHLKDERVHSIMIEVNRSLYMDETTGGKAASFRGIKVDIRDLIEVVARK
jgi:N-formylglutamate deformylase